MVGVVEVIDAAVVVVIRFLAMEIIPGDRLTQGDSRPERKTKKGVLGAAGTLE